MVQLKLAVSPSYLKWKTQYPSQFLQGLGEGEHVPRFLFVTCGPNCDRLAIAWELPLPLPHTKHGPASFPYTPHFMYFPKTPLTQALDATNFYGKFKAMEKIYVEAPKII